MKSTRRGSFSVHRSEETPGSKYSSTSGLSPRGCDSTITLNLTVNSSLYDVAELVEITFYPNPTSGKVTFSKEIEKIEVIDNIGKVVMRFFDTNEINIEALPAGAYYLRMTIEDKTIMRKVIKE